MSIYIVRRLLQGIVVLFLSSFMIYSILISYTGRPERPYRYNESVGYRWGAI